jgi:antitoxin CptB
MAIYMNETLELKRKRLLYQSLHRGTKENDMVLGRFASAHMHALSEAELELYEALLGENDNILWDWFTHKELDIPQEYKDLIRRILSS